MSEESIVELASKLEALLFISTDNLTKDELTRALDICEEELDLVVDSLRSRLERSRSAIELREVASGFQLFTKGDYQDFLEEYIASNDNRKLSTSSIETLAIVAYCQPITRSQIAEIRGANSDQLVSGLVRRGYVCEVGVADDGGAALFGTTNAFLDAIGILDIAELPPLEQFAPDAETRVAIAERLGAIRERNSTLESSE